MANTFCCFSPKINKYLRLLKVYCDGYLSLYGSSELTAWMSLLRAASLVFLVTWVDMLDVLAHSCLFTQINVSVHLETCSCPLDKLKCNIYFAFNLVLMSTKKYLYL